MTELDAVNECLSAVRQAPVATLSGTLETEVSLARSTVASISFDVQSEASWWFNTLYDGTLTRDGSNKVNAPGEVLYVSWGPDAIEKIPTFRGTALWWNNAGTDTDVWTFNPSYNKLTFLRTFDQLPNSAQRYIAMRAARVYADKLLAGQAPTRSATSEEISALRRLKREHLATLRPNALISPVVYETAFRNSLRGDTWID
jgi:hypothetical protein